MNKVSNAEVRSYFENRFEELSDAMRRSMTNRCSTRLPLSRLTRTSGTSWAKAIDVFPD